MGPTIRFAERDEATLAPCANARRGMEEAFVLRDPLRLACKGSHVLLHAAEKRASALGVAASVAVVDENGALVALTRMDGASPALVDRAVAAARSGSRGPEPPDAATAVVVDGVAIGTVGVACDGANDALACAAAALGAFGA